MTILDSSFIIDVFHNKPDAVNLLDDLERNEPALLVAAPTVMELWLGVLKNPNREMKRVEAFLSSVSVLPLNSSSAKRAAEIEAELLSKGAIIEVEDMMIAGIALTNGESVVTSDAHFARIPGLRVIKY